MNALKELLGFVVLTSPLWLLLILLPLALWIGTKAAKKVKDTAETVVEKAAEAAPEPVVETASKAAKKAKDTAESVVEKVKDAVAGDDDEKQKDAS